LNNALPRALEGQHNPRHRSEGTTTVCRSRSTIGAAPHSRGIDSGGDAHRFGQARKRSKADPYQNDVFGESFSRQISHAASLVEVPQDWGGGASRPYPPHGNVKIRFLTTSVRNDGNVEAGYEPKSVKSMEKNLCVLGVLGVLAHRIGPPGQIPSRMSPRPHLARDDLTASALHHPGRIWRVGRRNRHYPSLLRRRMGILLVL
jgi:hypothetical protein